MYLSGTSEVGLISYMPEGSKGIVRMAIQTCNLAQVFTLCHSSYLVEEPI